MPSQKNFKVIIAGGSIAGLTLAHTLDRAGIDFVVLEAYDEIAPQVGASIGLFPNGLRILDQLGLWSDIEKLVKPQRELNQRDPNGKAFYRLGAGQLIEACFGYPICFLDRQMVLEVMYRRIEDKSKVLVGHRVVNVKQTEKGVQVTTENGKIFEGDIVIGADGVHSTVRKEMQRIADKAQPGIITEKDKTGMFAEYCCIFGISKPTGGMQEGTGDVIYNESFSLLSLIGLGGRVFWFLFVKLDKRYYVPNIPRFTEAECEKIVQKHFRANINEKVVLEDLWKNRITSTLTALEEHVFERWHFGRIAFMGDSAHKMTPNFGQGGNSCIEAVATFTNILNRTLTTQTGRLNSEQITAIFSEFQKSRIARTNEIFDVASRLTRLQARDGLKMKLFGRYITPFLGEDYIMKSQIEVIKNASKLDYVDAPYNQGVVPWGDSAAAKRIQRSRFEVVLGSTLLAGLSIAAIRLVHVAGLRNGLFGIIEKIVENKYFVEKGIALETRYTGIDAVDKTLATMVTAFTPASEVFDEGYALFFRQFIVTILPVVAIWTIEGRRRGNAFTAAAFPMLFGVLYQLFTIGLAGPLYYLLHYLQIKGSHIHHWPNYRHVPLQYAKTLLPTLIIAFLIPTLLMFAPTSLISDSNTRQLFVAFWQPFPIFVSFVHRYLSSFCERDWLKSHMIEEPDATSDMFYLRTTYLFTFIVSAIAHIWAAFISVTSANPDLHWYRVWTLFIPSIDEPVTSLAEGIHRLIHYDYYLSFAAGIVWVLLAVADLKRSGKTQVGWPTVFIAVIGGWLLVGPGAVMAAAWAWREEILAFGKNKEDGKAKDL